MYINAHRSPPAGTMKISATSTTWRIHGVARCMPFATACGQTATCWSWAFATTMMWSAVGEVTGWLGRLKVAHDVFFIMGNH